MWVTDTDLEICRYGTAACHLTLVAYYFDPEGTPHSVLYGEAPQYTIGVGKIAILVYERVTKSATKRKKWWLKRSVSKGTTFWQK